MARVFEDEFMDIQSGMVSLALEALEAANVTVDKIYIYAFGTEHMVFFNLFFQKDGKVLKNLHAGIPEELLDQVLDLGIEDTGKLREICKEYGREPPCQCKLVYDCRTGQFDSDYSYDDLSDTEYGVDGVFADWHKEVEATLNRKE